MTKATSKAPPALSRWDTTRPWRRRTYGEPSLHDLLSDPIIRMMMDCDGVALAELLNVISVARAATLHSARLPMAVPPTTCQRYFTEAAAHV